MGRRLRIEYYGAVYHIIQKGNNGEHVFKEEEDKINILEILSETKEICDFKIFAYIVMDNHYHFLIQTLNIPISKIMHNINFKYARYYNNKTNRTGSVFEDRYTGILVQDERYLLTIMKYIHSSPIAANICNTMEEYKWSSDVFYRVNMEGMVDIEEVLKMFSPNRIEAINQYIEFMEEEIDFKTMKHICEDNPIIGTEKFVKSIKGIDDKKRLSLDEILIKSCPTQEEYKLIKKGCRKRYLTEYKSKYIQEGREQGYTFDEIGQNIGITGVAARSLTYILTQ
ncbi:transposase [Schnuerera sp. xch1]|uniref:transposase n=1 Tax=Schnuerera sp. xch1 TaxID=2874283 RepID=UPI001CC16EEE|nr:transposase [Schnuerera sp. xch1]MBZ2175890.1 transposase [Schnuerera sp. xch1]